VSVNGHKGCILVKRQCVYVSAVAVFPFGLDY
jgi:hypothetical protein